MERPKPKARRPRVAVRAGQGALEAHVGQLAHGPRREAVAAGLLPRELLLLHDDDVPAGVGQPVAAGGTRRARHRRPPRRGRARRPRRAAVAAGGRRGRCRPAPWLGRRPSCRAALPRGLPPSWRRPCRASPSWPPPASWPGPSPSAPPSWGRRAGGSRREPSRGHRRSAAGASDQRRGCAWRRGRMVETEHRGPVPPDPHPGAARPRLHRLLAGVLGHAGAAEEADARPSWRPTSAASSPTSSRPSASRCASTWSP